MSTRARLIPAVLALALGSPLLAAAGAAPATDDLLSLDLDQLLDIEVELASRVQERAFDAATAIYVIGRADIERAVSSSLPDLLRQVPGLHVGQWDGNKWAVSSRNALGRFTSTLLVMVDGRHVYTPLYGGVRWEQLNLPLVDVERIEVVRGPGGPLWGANAVDGIINIVTRRPADTRGTLVAGGAGSGGVPGGLVVRHGSGTGDLAYRATASYAAFGEGIQLPLEFSTHRGAREAGAEGNDGGTARRLDMRVDWDPDGPDSAIVVAGVLDSDFDEERIRGLGVVANTVAQRVAYAQADWRRATADGGEWRLALAATHGDVEDDIAIDRETLLDFDLQRASARGPLQVTWGLGFRRYRSTLRPPDRDSCDACFGAHPERGGNDTASGFVHGRWQLAPSVAVIAGTKIESSDYVDFAWQPTVRIVAGDSARTLWAAATRAVRTPTRLDRDLAFFRVPDSIIGFFGCLEVDGDACVVGNRDAEPWVVDALEAGFRAQPSPRFGYDLVLFRHDFRNTLQGPETIGRDQVHGVEAEARIAVSEAWQLGLGHAFHEGRDALADGGSEPLRLLPRHTSTLRSNVQVSPSWSFETQALRVSSLSRGPSFPPIPAYTRVDLKLVWRPRPGVSAELRVVDALDEVRAEYIEALKVNTGFGRGVALGLEWRFD